MSKAKKLRAKKSEAKQEFDEPPWGQLIRQIHDAHAHMVLAVTGGGSQAIAALLEVPGASRTVLEAIVPYSPESLAAFLGARPEQSCSQRTARAMAMAAYQRALRYVMGEAPAPQPLAGVACTASLVSDRPKHGPHRVHVALQTATTTLAQSVELVKGRRSRAEEEALAAKLVLNLAAEAGGIDERVEAGFSPVESLQVARSEAPGEWQGLLDGRREAVAVRTGAAKKPAVRRLIFPGAFNPRHDAHRRMAQMAAEQLGLPVEHEISILNVDKPPLDFLELEHRAAQFAADETLWLTRAATFAEKAVMFAPATFIVGADTIARIAHPRYYGGEPACQAAIDRMAALDCRFLVFGRQVQGCFHVPGTLGLHESLLRLCDVVPADRFRHDVSSTALRKASDGGSEITQTD
ncbi:MAG TPA: hypothetical protein VJ783_03795 [Pirellulales bacterium]|nr:hypothetical protein [Pirellulales bacterium]